MDLIGMDVTWTAEFAEAGWIREITGADKDAATEDTLQPTIDTAVWKDKLYGIPKHTNVQLLWYRKSLVPTASQDLGRGDRGQQAAEVGGQALRHRDHRARSTKATSWASTRSCPRSAARSSTTPAPRSTVNDKTVDALKIIKAPRDRRPGQQVAVEQPGARGLRPDAERRGRVHHELALRARRR